jgi:formylglycine-generating enzyme required for sulfatase activity
MDKKKMAIIGGGAAVVIVAAIAIFLMTREEKTVVVAKVEKVTGPDPARIARIAELGKQIEDYESKGRFKEALWALKELAGMEPGDPRLSARPRLEEKLRRLEGWEGAHRKAEAGKKEATRTRAIADWQKVLDACAEAEKFAPTEEQLKLTREIAALARQQHNWGLARDEEKKGNLAAALELATQAISAMEPPTELAAYKTDLERKKRKQEFDKAASAARAEGTPAKAYGLWEKARPLAEDPKDVAEADAKLHALKPWVDPAERDRRYDEAMKAGEASLTAGNFDAAEKSFKEAQALKVTELKAPQALTRVNAARSKMGYEAALAEAKAAEDKKEWADALEALDKAIRIRPDAALAARRKTLEETRRPPKISFIISSESGVKMDFVLIKRGKFMMGDAQGDSDEKPHEVVVAKDFWMQPTELTQAQWAAVMNSKPWLSASIPHMPVEGVSWEDTQKFFEKLNVMAREQLQGRRASLPSEEEWEYACRAGTTTKWSFGNDEGQFDLHGWYGKSGVKGPQTVGQKPANPWGLFDMHGNVAEWCSDAYVAYGDKAPAEPQFRSFRGGSWNDRVALTRSSKREKDLPTKTNMFLGFRAILR